METAWESGGMGPEWLEALTGGQQVKKVVSEMQQGRRVAGQQQLLVQAIIPQDTEEVQLVLSLLYQGVVFWVHVSLAETTFKYL